MRKLATTSVAAAVLATGLAAASTTSDAAGPTAAQRTQHVMRLLVHQIESHPLGENHPAGADRLRFLASHKIAGYESFSGVFNPKTDRLRFWLADALEGGIIVSYFDLDTQKTGNTFTGRITHGTGRYSGIHGTLHVRNSDGGRTVYTLRYTL